LFYYEGTKEIKKEVDIDNRDWELWKPILVMAKMVNDDLYLKMNSFAKNMTNEYQKDEKEGWEYTIIKVLKENVDIERYYFVSEMRNWLINEYENIEEVPKTRSIGWELKRMGLTDRKREGNKGHKWLLNKKIVDNLVLKLGISEETSPIPMLKDGVVSDVCDVSGRTTGQRNFYNNIKKRVNNGTNTSLLVPPTELTPQTSLTTPKDITKNVMEIITHLSSKQDVIPIENILKTARNAQISEENVEEAIEHLKRGGIVFEPRNGFIKKL